MSETIEKIVINIALHKMQQKRSGKQEKPQQKSENRRLRAVFHHFSIKMFQGTRIHLNCYEE